MLLRITLAVFVDPKDTLLLCYNFLKSNYDIRIKSTPEIRRALHS